MTSKASARFWKCHNELPRHVQTLALKNYRIWQQNPQHSSLDFKKLYGSGQRFSVRVGNHHRAIGREVSGGVEWVWIGSHEEYNGLISRSKR